MFPESTAERLPRRIVKLASEMFAGPITGFSGPEIVDYFAEHSDDVQPYAWGGGSPSRRTLFEGGLALLDVATQREVLLELCDYDGPMKYNAPSDDDRQKLREFLGGAPSSAGLVKSVAAKLDWASVNRDLERAMKQVSTDPEGAITAARSLVETVCKHILDGLGLTYDDDGDLGKLYKVTARAMNLSPDQHSEDVFRQILSGCTSVVNGLSGLRNAFGDSHGKGQKYVTPSPRHAKLGVSSAGAVALFLIETYIARGGS